MTSQTEECCPKFNLEKWDRQSVNWNNQLFLKETIPTFFHMPLPSMIGKKISRMYNLAESANAQMEDISEALILFRDPSAFKSEIYYAVSHEVEGGNNTELSGKFETMVFSGGYNEIPKFIKEMNKYLKEKGLEARDYYVHYAYCPECAKKYGDNYILLLAEL